MYDVDSRDLGHHGDVLVDAQFFEWRQNTAFGVAAWIVADQIANGFESEGLGERCSPIADDGTQRRVQADWRHAQSSPVAI